MATNAGHWKSLFKINISAVWGRTLLWPTEVTSNTSTRSRALTSKEAVHEHGHEQGHVVDLLQVRSDFVYSSWQHRLLVTHKTHSGKRPWMSVLPIPLTHSLTRSLSSPSLLETRITDRRLWRVGCFPSTAPALLWERHVACCQFWTLR